MSDEDRRATVLDGQDLQRRWSCPRAGFPWPTTSDGLDGGCRSVLQHVAEACGFSNATTCPRAYLSLRWVQRGARAYRYRESGSLGMIEAAPLPAVLVEAIEVIGAAYTERLDDERKRREAEARKRTVAKGGDPWR